MNFRMDSESPMALILAGQPELYDKLRGNHYLAIRQRINMKCFLRAYELAQTKKYIERHLRYAGAQSEIFSEAAVEEAQLTSFLATSKPAEYGQNASANVRLPDKTQAPNKAQAQQQKEDEANLLHPLLAYSIQITQLTYQQRRTTSNTA